MDHLAGEPHPQQNSDVTAPLNTSDAALDALLGRAAPALIEAGFAERVIQAVQPTLGTVGTRRVLRPQGLRPLMAMGLAAAVAVCGGLAWRSVSSPGTRLTSAPGRAGATPTEEEVLLRALTTLENTAGDLALVAQLGEVLEAELTGRTSWLETE